MFALRNQIYFTLFLGLFASLALASPLRGGGQLPNGRPPPRPLPPARPEPRCPANIQPREQRTFLGYTGITGKDRLRQFQREPVASLGGELGAVLYIADSVDLASMFARGPRADENYICLLYADTAEWHQITKSWVSYTQLRRGSAYMNRFAPGAVLFADHTNAGLPHGAPHSVHQMGIRQGQIRRLRVTAQCYRKSCFTSHHNSLNYRDLSLTWDIHAAPTGDLRKKSEPVPKKVLEHLKQDIHKLEHI